MAKKVTTAMTGSFLESLEELFTPFQLCSRNQKGKKRKSVESIKNSKNQASAAKMAVRNKVK